MGKIIGWHHRLNGLESEQTLGDGERQGSLVCCSPWGHKELGTTEQLNGNKPYGIVPLKSTVVPATSLLLLCFLLDILGLK